MVDLRVREEGGRLEYDLLLAPGADLEQVLVRCKGIEGLDVEAEGVLRIETAVGSLRQEIHGGWQILPDGARRPIRCGFRALEGRRFGFHAEGGESSLPLIIDPGLDWSTFVNGAVAEEAYGLSVFPSGDVVVVGYTGSPTFPTTPGAFDPTFNPSNAPDAFVIRVNADGTGLVFSTFLGGEENQPLGNDYARSVAVDPKGSVTVIGFTASPTFPVTAGAYDTTYNGGQTDVFATRLNPTGTALLSSTYLGSSHSDYTGAVTAIATDGVTTLCGGTLGANFPVTPGAPQSTYAGGSIGYGDGFVSQLDPSGSSLLFSTYLGGSADDAVGGVALDPSGDAVVCGITESSSFPITTGAFDTTWNGSFDVFLARIDTQHGVFIYSTFLGGSGYESAAHLSLDTSGGVTVGGRTFSSDFPLLPVR